MGGAKSVNVLDSLGGETVTRQDISLQSKWSPVNYVLRGEASAPEEGFTGSQIVWLSTCTCSHYFSLGVGVSLHCQGYLQRACEG